MRAILLFIFSIFGSVIFAQTFTELMNTSFEGVTVSAIAFADVDGDNDQDVIMTGQDNSTPYIRITSLYINNGLGDYTKVVDTPFEGVSSGSVSFADVDLDGDQDLLIAGLISPSFSITKLYLNDGAGNFTESMDNLFDGVFSSSIAFSDVDGDNDRDVLIMGYDLDNSPGGPSTNLYLNDGEGNFNLMSGTPFIHSSGGSISFADVDGDNDQDVLLTGKNNDANPSTYFSTLYLNDGVGNYSEMIDTPFEAVKSGSVAFADIDGDGDQDVLINGLNVIGVPLLSVTKLYTNDGSGTFSEVLDTPFEAVYSSSIAFADVDGDSDQDLIITGGNQDTIGIAKLYINQSITSSLEVEVSSVEFNLYPNPVGDKNLELSFTSNEKKRLTISLLDLNGRTLKQFSEQISAGENNFPLDVSSIPNGSYFIKLDDGKTNGVQKVIIQ